MIIWMIIIQCAQMDNAQHAIHIVQVQSLLHLSATTTISLMAWMGIFAMQIAISQQTSISTPQLADTTAT
jgi:hypothetical protein